MVSARAFAAIVLTAATLAPRPGCAAEAGPAGPTGEPSYADPVRAELVAEQDGIRPGEPFWVGVRLEMTDGWHINWINPGDAGLAPAVVWTLPPGFSAGEIIWPYPRRYDISGLSIFGYENEVLLMCRVAPPADLAAGKEVTLEAGVTWLACREACLPGDADLTLSLRVIARTETAQADARRRAVFERTRSEIPLPPDGWRIAAAVSGDYLAIEAAPLEGLAPAIEGLAFFPFQQGIIENNAPQTLKMTGAACRLEVRRDRMSSDTPKRLAGILISQNGWGSMGRKAVEIDVPVD